MVIFSCTYYGEWLTYNDMRMNKVWLLNDYKGQTSHLIHKLAITEKKNCLTSSPKSSLLCSSIFHKIPKADAIRDWKWKPLQWKCGMLFCSHHTLQWTLQNSTLIPVVSSTWHFFIPVTGFQNVFMKIINYNFCLPGGWGILSTNVSFSMTTRAEKWAASYVRTSGERWQSAGGHSIGKYMPPNGIGARSSPFTSYKQVYHSSLHVKFRNILYTIWGTQWHSWLRHWATSQKVVGSIPDGVTGIFHWHNPSSHTMALGLTQPLT